MKYLKSNKLKLFFLLWSVLAIVLLFLSLGEGVLYPDEAMSANLSWNVLKFGFPRAWDGRNIITNYNNGAEFTKSFVWIFHPWVSFYVGAVSLLIAGKSAFGARFLYAVFGWLTLVSIYWFILKISGKQRLALLALVVATLAVPFLLFSRCAHYYVLVMFFAVWSLYFYDKFLEKASAVNIIMLATGLLLLFYSQYVYFVVLFGSIFLHYFIFFFRKKDLRANLKFGVVSVLVVGLIWPWVSFAILPVAAGMQQTVRGFNHGFYGFFSNIFALLWKMQTFVYPVVTLTLIGGLLNVFGSRRRNLSVGLPKVWVVLLWLVIAMDVVLCALLWQHPLVGLRRIILTLLMGLVLCADHLWRILNKQKVIGIICIGLVLFTNWLGIFPYTLMNYLKVPTAKIAFMVKSPYTFWLHEDSLYAYLIYLNKPGSYLWEFLMDLWWPPLGRTEAVVDYLIKNADPEDVFVAEGGEAEILVFHTGLRAAHRLVKEEKSFLKMNSYFGLSKENVERYAHLTEYAPERIKWIISGNYYLISEYRYQNAEHYFPIEVWGADYYMKANHDLDHWDRFHAWQQRPDRFWIYKRK